MLGGGGGRGRQHQYVLTPRFFRCETYACSGGVGGFFSVQTANLEGPESPRPLLIGRRRGRHCAISPAFASQPPSTHCARQVVADWFPETEITVKQGQQSVKEVIRARAARQIAWLKRKAPGQPSGAHRPKKRHRKSALQWLHHLDTQVQDCRPPTGDLWRHP